MAFDRFCNDPLLGEHDLGYRDRLTARAVKFYMDGALGSRREALLDDYSDDPGNRGHLLHRPESFQKDVADEFGSLEPGKRTDFVMLSKDTMQVPASEILVDAQVTATYLDGQRVYVRDEQE